MKGFWSCQAKVLVQSWPVIDVKQVWIWLDTRKNFPTCRGTRVRLSSLKDFKTHRLCRDGANSGLSFPI